MRLDRKAETRRLEPPKTAPGRFWGYLGSPGGFRRAQRVQLAFNFDFTGEWGNGQGRILRQFGKVVRYGC